MTTQAVVEALLYVNPSSRRYLRSAHVISEERNWQPKEHPEFTFIRYFTDPVYLVFIESEIHVYIVGDPVSRNIYNVINIEGFRVDHLVVSKQQLREEIKTTISQTKFLPEPLSKRVIFMKNGITPYIFNRFDDKKFVTKTEWTLGVDIYDASARTYKISFNDLFRAIEDEYKKFGE